MKKRLFSMLLCLCVLVSAVSFTALAAGDTLPAGMPEETALYLNGEKLVPTAEGATLTFENGGVATLTTVGDNEAGGVDYALTLENVRSTETVRQEMASSVNSAGLFFLTTNFIEGHDTLAITLKGRNSISAAGQADEAAVTALVVTCATSISGEGSLNLMARPAEGSETACYGMNVTGDLTIGSSVMCVPRGGSALSLRGEVTFTDGATLRWPTELQLAAQEGTPVDRSSSVLMNGEAAADMMIVAAPTDQVTRSVAVFNLWKLMGSPAPEGEYPFTDTMVAGDFMKDAIHWAGTTGISKGCGNGMFNGMDPITNEQFAVLFYRMIGSPAVEGDFPADYPYADAVSPWAREAMVRAASQGWVRDPKGILTHAEMDRLVGLLDRLQEQQG